MYEVLLMSHQFTKLRCSPEVGTREDCLGILEGLNLVGASLLTKVKILKKEITLGMEVSESGGDEAQVLIGICQHTLLRLKLSLKGGLCTSLGGDSLAVGCTSRLRLSHEFGIIVRRSLLLVLCIFHVCLNLANHHVHEANHACTFLAFLVRHIKVFVVLCMSTDLCKAASLHDFIFHRHLRLGWCLVHGRVVKFLKAILCLPNERHRCLIQLHHLQVIRMLFLALLRGLCNSLVEVFDVLFQSCNRLCESFDLIGHLTKSSLMHCLLLLGGLIFILSLFELIFTKSLGFIISRLIFPEQNYHIINHFDDAFQALGLTLMGQLQLGVQGVQQGIELCGVGL